MLLSYRSRSFMQQSLISMKSKTKRGKPSWWFETWQRPTPASITVKQCTPSAPRWATWSWRSVGGSYSVHVIKYRTWVYSCLSTWLEHFEFISTDTCRPIYFREVYNTFYSLYLTDLDFKTWNSLITILLCFCFRFWMQYIYCNGVFLFSWCRSSPCGSLWSRSSPSWWRWWSWSLPSCSTREVWQRKSAQQVNQTQRDTPVVFGQFWTLWSILIWN